MNMESSLNRSCSLSLFERFVRKTGLRKRYSKARMEDTDDDHDDHDHHDDHEVGDHNHASSEDKPQAVKCLLNGDVKVDILQTKYSANVSIFLIIVNERDDLGMGLLLYT